MLQPNIPNSTSSSLIPNPIFKLDRPIQSPIQRVPSVLYLSRVVLSEAIVH